MLVIHFQRRDFKDPSGAKPGTLFPMADVWLPIQAEVHFPSSVKHVGVDKTNVRFELCSMIT